ncbi:hypothetical protein AB0H24_19270 [Streptomyces globisporus]|uniref:hypothetical protein n=1 Tax=Streptomyces globisporus TaxID=1908 RepID=UPI00345F6B17
MGTAQLHGIRAAGDDVFRLVAELLSGCGMRNGEAPAVSINNIVANNAYRITEQVNQTTKTYAPPQAPQGRRLPRRLAPGTGQALHRVVRGHVRHH